MLPYHPPNPPLLPRQNRPSSTPRWIFPVVGVIGSIIILICAGLLIYYARRRNVQRSKGHDKNSFTTPAHRISDTNPLMSSAAAPGITFTRPSYDVERGYGNGFGAPLPPPPQQQQVQFQERSGSVPRSYPARTQTKARKAHQSIPLAIETSTPSQAELPGQATSPVLSPLRTPTENELVFESSGRWDSGDEGERSASEDGRVGNGRRGSAYQKVDSESEDEYGAQARQISPLFSRPPKAYEGVGYGEGGDAVGARSSPAWKGYRQQQHS